MRDEKSGLTEEILQLYYDGELPEQKRQEVEALLDQAPGSRERLRLYGRVSALLGALGDSCEPDELSARRNWEQIARARERKILYVPRRTAWWLGVTAAAAALLIFLSAPFQQAQSNELEIESIDCSYPGLMLINPASEDGVTIIWIDENGD